jgi:type I restriction enzyme S subunit
MLLSNLRVLVAAPDGVARLRALILTLAVQGKLVAQDPNDEPASALLKKIRAEKDRLTTVGKLKRHQPLAKTTDDQPPFGLPVGWAWSNLATIGIINPKNEVPDETLASFVQMSSIPVAFSEAHDAEPRPWSDIKCGFTQFADGDIGVAKITPCFENAKSTVFQGLTNGIGAGTTELHIVRPLGGIAPRYVLLFVKTPAFLQGGEAVMTGCAGQKRVPRGYFESKPFPLPPLAEQSRIVTRVEELMRLCDAIEAKGQLDVARHAQLVAALLGTLTHCETPEHLSASWQRIATHFDLLLDRPQAVDALEQTMLQLAVSGQLVPQDPHDEPASALLKKVRLEKDRLVTMGQIKRDKRLPPIEKNEQPFALPLGWAWVRLRDVVSHLGDGLHGTPNFAPNGNCYFVNGNNLGAGVITIKPETRRIDVAEYERYKKPLDTRSVLVSINGTLGRVALYRGEQIILGKSVCYFNVTSGLEKMYARLLLECPDFVAYAQTNATGTTIRNLGLKAMGDWPIALPPLTEQSRIVARVATLRSLCADLRACLSASQRAQDRLAQALVTSVTP